MKTYEEVIAIQARNSFDKYMQGSHEHITPHDVVLCISYIYDVPTLVINVDLKTVFTKLVHQNFPNRLSPKEPL